MISESASARRGAGQGKTCGTPTIRKDASSVAVKRDMVDRDRGWRCEDIFDRGSLARAWVPLYCRIGLRMLHSL